LVSPSSTSSSDPKAAPARRGWRAWPWAALLAILSILVADRAVLGLSGPWGWIHARVGPNGSVYQGVAYDRKVFADLAADESDDPRVFIMGTSRARRGHRMMQSVAALPDVRIARVAHPMMDLFTIRTLTREVIDAGADGVVLMISEFDTHRPLRLDPLPTRSGAAPSALLEIVSDVGLSFGWENRVSLYRLATSRMLNGYRFRESLARGGLDRLRRFELDDRLQGSRMARMQGRAATALGSAVRGPLDVTTQVQLHVQVQPELHKHLNQAPWIAETQRGEHARVQMGVLRRTVEELLIAGVWVVIIEAPLHPAAKILKDPGARAEFVELVRDLDDYEGVRFIGLSEMPPFENQDFRDLLHVDMAGGRRLTAVMVKAVAEQLEITKQRGRPGERAGPGHRG